jgi:hypothetical protein
MLYFGFKIPAGHLTKRKAPRKFVGGNIHFSFADAVSNIKCFTDREFYTVENGTIRCRFLGFAFGASARKGFLPLTRVGISTFLTHKTIDPFDPCQKFEAFLITLEHFLKLLRTKVLAENRVHDLIVYDANVKK